MKEDKIKNKRISDLLIPKTLFGKLSIISLILSVVFFMVFFVFLIVMIPILALGGSPSEKSFLGISPLSIPGFLAGIFGTSAFFTGIVSIIKKKEKCIFVYLSTMIGFFIFILSLGQIFD